jgi:hypothetical protein
MKLAPNNIFAACIDRHQAMLQTEFAAPVLRGRPVVVAVGDSCRRVQMVPPMFQGWAVARLVSPNVAVVAREADDVERQRLLNQWPQVSMQVCHVSSLGVLAVRLTDDAAQSIVRLHLCDDAVTANDIVLARFDGRQHWFDRITARNCGSASVDFAVGRQLFPDLATATFATGFPVEADVLDGQTN